MKRHDFMDKEHVHTLEEDIKFIIDSGYTFDITYIEDKNGIFSVTIDSLIFPTGEYCAFPHWEGNDLKKVMNEATGYIDQQNQYTEAVVYDYVFRDVKELKPLAEKILNFRGLDV